MTIVSRTVRCRCRCHDPATDDGVDTRDAIEAVTACADCINDHCAALVDDSPRSRPLPTEWIDPPRPADACGDEGEGRE